MALGRLRFNAWLVVALGHSIVLNGVLLALSLRLLRRPIESSLASPWMEKSEPLATRTEQGQRPSRVITAGLPRSVRAVLRGHLGRINTIAYAPDCSTIVAATHMGLLSIWDLRGGAFSLREPKHGPENLGLARRELTSGP